jgi:nucleotide-binding universal stress UspA family protein
MTAPFTAPSIIVGVDGSRAAAHAAVWAIDEALGRDLPLHLVAVSEPADTNRARQAVSEAALAVTDARRDVTVQTTVVTGAPTPALLNASAAAVMICVGHRGQDNVGSTVRTLVASAHCPVAVVRGADKPGRWVVVELDGSPDSAAVLQYAVEEARLRSAPLRVVGTWQTDGPPTAEVTADRMVHAQLDRRLEQWKHRYPDLDVLPVAVHGSGLDYLTANAAAIGLVVIGARNTDGVAELLGPRHTDCSILVIDPQRLL